MINSDAQHSDTLKVPGFGLQCVVRPPAMNRMNPPVLFMFHGAGSNEHDLFALADQIPDEWLIISARAPYQVGEGRYNWYEVKLDDGKIRINFNQEEASRKAILNFMDETVSYYHADTTRIVLAGFSQGANMASAVSLTSPEKVAGFAVFSGRYVEEIQPLISKSGALGNLKCFLAHGNQDLMLPMTYAIENRSQMEALGINVAFSEDKTGHTISKKQLGDFLLWLKQL